MRAFTVWLLLGMLWHMGSALAEDSSSETLPLARKLEEQALSRLARVQADPANTIAELTTDGCSGGLSDGWATLSRLLPPFRAAFGDRPPYELCCTTHDRAYWRGETAQGYAARLEADDTLRRCVVEYGVHHRAEFSARFHLGEDAIVRNFEVIGDLMYAAVRAGGQPCSLLPWRWGYGWPHCNEGSPDPGPDESPEPGR